MESDTLMFFLGIFYGAFFMFLFAGLFVARRDNKHARDVTTNYTAHAEELHRMRDRAERAERA